MTQIIPTDKYGKVYYGPKTIAALEAQIDEAIEQADISSAGPARIEAIAEIARKRISDVEAAGYKGVANKVRADYRRAGMKV